MILVRGNNSGEATVHDNVAGSFSGPIQVSSEGALIGTLSNGGQTITLQGTFTLGPPASFSGTISGAVNATVTADYVDNGDSNVFAGPYSGTFAGDDSGTWQFTVGSDGHISGTATDGVYNYNFTGSVSGTGDSTITGSGSGGGATFTYTGTFYPDVSGFACTGTWESNNDLSGTWAGHSGD